jgi:hypothetical protein
VHQAKYTEDIVRKFKMEDSKAMTTPMSTNTALDADEEGEHVDQKEYRSMIGSLLYLTTTRPDIQFSVCLCARFQASPRTSHRQAVKRIFRSGLKGFGNRPDRFVPRVGTCPGGACICAGGLLCALVVCALCLSMVLSRMCRAVALA